MRKIWTEWRGFFLFLVIMLLFRSAVADWNHVPSESMVPSILVGDRVVVNKIAYDLRVPFTLKRIAQWDNPKRGDVVTFPSPRDEILLIKRVIGLPGDVVELADNKLIINGEAATYRSSSIGDLPGVGSVDLSAYDIFEESILGDTRYIMLQRRGGGRRHQSLHQVKVPENTYLMLGDNRDESADSRVIGFVNRDRIIGRANSVAFSLNYENNYLPRSDRLFETLP